MSAQPTQSASPAWAMAWAITAALAAFCAFGSPPAQAQSGDFCAEPAQACAAIVPSFCRGDALDAASVPANPACAEAMNAYRGCLSRIVEECGDGRTIDLHRHPDAMLSAGFQQCRGSDCTGEAAMLMVYSQEAPVSLANGEALLYRLGERSGASLALDLSSGLDRFAADQAQLVIQGPVDAGAYLSCVTYTHPEESGTWALIRGHRVTVMSEQAIGPMVIRTLNTSHILPPDVGRAPAGGCREAVAQFLTENDLD